MLGMMMMYLLTEGTSCHQLVVADLCLQGVLSYTTNNDRKTTAAAHLQVVKLVRHPLPQQQLLYILISTLLRTRVTAATFSGHYRWESKGVTSKGHFTPQTRVPKCFIMWPSVQALDKQGLGADT